MHDQNFLDNSKNNAQYLCPSCYLQLWLKIYQDLHCSWHHLFPYVNSFTADSLPSSTVLLRYNWHLYFLCTVQYSNYMSFVHFKLFFKQLGMVCLSMRRKCCHSEFPFSSWLAGSSSSGFTTGFTTAATPSTGVSLDAADIAVVVVYFIFVMVVGIWVRTIAQPTLHIIWILLKL